MRANLWLGLAVVGVAAALCGSAAATPIPVVYLDMNGNLTNQGSGGSAYDGVLQDGTAGEVSAYVTDRSSTAEGALCLNPTMSITTATTTTNWSTGGVANQFGNSIAVTYTLPDAGTINVWYQTASTGYNYEEIWNNSGDFEEWESWIYSDARGAAMRAGYNGGGANQKIGGGSTTTTVSRGAWTNFAFTWQKTSTGVDLVEYINGVAKASGSFTNGWRAPGTTFYLGGSHGNTPSLGSFDDLAIYNTVLSASDIATVYSSGVTLTPEPGTIALLTTGLLGLLAYAWRKRR